MAKNLFINESFTKKTAAANRQNKNGNAQVEKNFSPLLNLVPIPVVYIDKTRIYRYVNSAYCNWHGITPTQVIGKTVEEFISKELLAHIQPLLNRVFNGELVTFAGEVPFQNTLRSVEATYTPDFDEEGNVQGTLIVIKDVTEETRKEKELQHKQKQLQDYVDNAVIGLH
ncbi:MAG: hypothetical protein C4329_11650 [Chitinophagaceae bacterium]